MVNKYYTILPHLMKMLFRKFITENESGKPDCVRVREDRRQFGLYRADHMRRTSAITCSIGYHISHMTVDNGGCAHTHRYISMAINIKVVMTVITATYEIMCKY